MIKALLRDTRIYDFVLARRRRRAIAQWEAEGRLIPAPPAVKQKIVTDYQRRYQCDALVETGTFFGDMIVAQRRLFPRIYSIELNESLYERAKRRFAAFPSITLLQGDSGEVLSTIIDQIPSRTLYWLDGHWSGDGTSHGEKATPVVEELKTILKRRDCLEVILIDDSRLFNGTADYPTMAELESLVHRFRPDARISNELDIIRVIVGSSD